MFLKRLINVSFLFFFSLLSVLSQTNNKYYIQDYKISIADTNKLFLQIHDINFVKNNEYFGNIVSGYTLLGLNIAPKLIYYPSSKIKLSAGVNLLSYYSREDEIELSILLSFQYKLHGNLDFVLGNIYSTVNHRLIDPLFDFERYLSNNVENGIQFLWNSERIFTDLWLDWEQQIFQDDPFQEIFNVGLSSEFFIYKNENLFNISIPFQNLFRHKGGQINSNSEPLTTIFNNATGLSISKSINQKYLHKLVFSSYIVNYQDLSPTNQQLFIDGTGSYTTLELNNTSIDFLLGFWHGEQFIAPIGNPMYESYSRTNIFVEEPIRQIITSKINYQKDIYKGINLGFRFDSYYDLLESNFEYAWGIVVVFNDRFLLKSF